VITPVRPSSVTRPHCGTCGPCFMKTASWPPHA